ncbi:hypothetical protein [Yinghuangia soli]|uniref:Uncharacterized protein n=1 Tax=Yinghuangia soli TaxID=2908204 RepID=A0AA41U090_9ACTN|nr:hypothetical protein [Yinghuangia soli]MCF2528135.1 hypothetical protein [Yinghuangia soli]
MTQTTDQPLARVRDAVRRTAELTRGRVASGTGHNDADDTEGTIGTDGAIGFDPLPLLAALDRAGARVAAIGQVAGIIHGSAELTGDLDLLWDGSAAQAAAVAAALAAVGGMLVEDDGTMVPPTAAAMRRPKWDYVTPTAGGDLCTPELPWGALDVAAFLARAEQAEGLDGTTMHFLRRTDLVAMRRAVGRPKDLRRADELDRLAAAETAEKEGKKGKAD